MDGLALSISIGLQYGVPLKALVDKLTNTRFEPSGFTENSSIRYASSVLDYIARWLGGKFLSPEYLKPRTLLGEDGTQAAGRLAARTAGAISREKRLSVRVETRLPALSAGCSWCPTAVATSVRIAAAPAVVFRDDALPDQEQTANHKRSNIGLLEAIYTYSCTSIMLYCTCLRRGLEQWHSA